MLPIGVTFADIQNLSREASELYPPLEPLPVLSTISEKDKRIAGFQSGFVSRLEHSKYYVVEKHKSTDLQRYSDKYRPSVSSRPALRKGDLHAPFFPKALLEEYFNPSQNKKTKRPQKRVNLDDLADDDDDAEKSDQEGSQVVSEGEVSDYDVDEEYDNDYAENYFDNGEGDDMDDLGGGGGGDEGGGGDYD